MIYIYILNGKFVDWRENDLLLIMIHKANPLMKENGICLFLYLVEKLLIE